MKMCVKELLCSVCTTFVLLIVFDTDAHSTHIDQSTYDEGRKQFELIQHRSELPHYSQCWKDAVVLTQTGCKNLTDDVQGRLALAYLNCFLDLHGREKYDCNQDDTLEKCTKTMKDSDHVSFTTFFTHTQNICYFLEAQVWNEMTKKTISELAESSSHVATQLQKSSQLQDEIMKQQNNSLQNQKILIKNAENLTTRITSSSEELSRLSQTFNETTQEQRFMITDMFGKLTILKKAVLGEFLGLHFILYYFFSVLVSYLLTSTTRTSSARFWLFSIMTVSIFCEYVIISWSSMVLAWISSNLKDHDDWMYWFQNKCRWMFASVALVVLAGFAFTYQDMEAGNNKLLVEIRKLNSDLSHQFIEMKRQMERWDTFPHRLTVTGSNGAEPDDHEPARTPRSEVGERNEPSQQDDHEPATTSQSKGGKRNEPSQQDDHEPATTSQSKGGKRNEPSQQDDHEPARTPQSKGGKRNEPSQQRYSMRPRRGRGSGSPTPTRKDRG